MTERFDMLPPHRSIVMSFGVLLAISFAVAGVGLVVMGLTQRRREAAAISSVTDMPAQAV
ncbi:MAG TPA: hypothetical protein VF650_03635 [Allosphingosinicella sp.]